MACIKAFLHSGLNSMLWIYLLCPLVSWAIFLEAGPRNKTVVEGDKVSLICDLNNDNDNTIFWTYLIGPGSPRYISSNDYIYPSLGYGVDPENYKVIIDQSQQTYKLVILAINLSTEAGIYECGYEKGPGRRYTPLASAMIIVSPFQQYVEVTTPPSRRFTEEKGPGRRYTSLAPATTNVSPFQQSVSCHQYRLSFLGSEVNQEFEVACSWAHGQPGEAYFDSSSGETIDVDLRFPGRIISRIESQDTPSIICRFLLDSDASSTVNAPCFGDDTPGLVRVDPFISEVTLGSSASFVCTSGNQNYSPEISWNVSIIGSDPRDSQDRLIENNDVLSILNVQDDDQDMLVECQVHISENLMVSSYASLRIVENTTPLSLTPRTRGSLVIVIIPVVKLLIIFFIIIPFSISFLPYKRKIKRKMNRKVKRIRTNSSEESLSSILHVIQTRDPNRHGCRSVIDTYCSVGDDIVIYPPLMNRYYERIDTHANRGENSGTEEQRNVELSLAIPSDSHPYSNKIYRSDSRLISTELVSELDLEPDNDRQTRQGSFQMETDFMEVNQKAPHFEVQSFEPFYETMQNEVCTSNKCEVKPKTSVHKRLMTSSSRPDEKQQELKDAAAEQKTSNISSSVAHWIVDPVDLHSRPLPRYPKNPITVQI